jgi:hypothetical protein
MSTEYYLFNNNGVYYAATPALISKTYEGITYSPVLIKRSALNITDNFQKSNITFSFSRDNSFAKDLLLYLPEVPVTVTIYKNNSTYWSGRVLEVIANPKSIEVKCDSIFTTLRQAGLPAKVSLTCRHTLYSYGCNVIRESFVENFTVVSITSATFTVNTLAKPNHYYTAGIAELNGQLRYILSQIGQTVKLANPFTGIQSGNLKLYPGCNKTSTDCLNKFNNLDNFGGFPSIPQKNPFDSTGLL